MTRTSPLRDVECSGEDCDRQPITRYKGRAWCLRCLPADAFDKSDNSHYRKGGDNGRTK